VFALDIVNAIRAQKKAGEAGAAHFAGLSFAENRGKGADPAPGAAPAA
jgi:hypothetical protein